MLKTKKNLLKIRKDFWELYGSGNFDKILEKEEEEGKKFKEAIETFKKLYCDDSKIKDIKISKEGIIFITQKNAA